ncbi:hypothetical protein [Shewanella donghaensis]|uniref:hypothetical protein n=1 Tax=Shewanella donghaensis TaxID=238836 RepID=UPI001182C1FF|nr:hypothetical protein [Shewanella donghaensis]
MNTQINTQINTKIKTIKRAVLLGLLLSVNSAVFAENSQLARDQFDAKTKPIFDRSQVISEKQLALMQEFNQVAESGSAVAIFTGGKVQELQALGEQTITEANQFITEYQQFLSQLPETSSCYLPENVEKYQGTVAEIAKANEALGQFVAPTDSNDEIGATMALLNLQMHAGRLSSVVQMFQLVKVCYMTDAMGLTKEDVKRMAAENMDEDY